MTKKKGEFQTNFDFNRIDEVNQILNHFETNIMNLAEMDDIVKKISDMSITSGLETGISKQIINNRNPNKNDRKNKPWLIVIAR